MFVGQFRWSVSQGQVRIIWLGGGEVVGYSFGHELQRLGLTLFKCTPSDVRYLD